jgi:hypothetical protein
MINPQPLVHHLSLKNNGSGLLEKNLTGNNSAWISNIKCKNEELRTSHPAADNDNNTTF